MNKKTVVGLVGAVGLAFVAHANSIWIPGSTGGWASPESWQGGVPQTGGTVEVPDGCDLPVNDADMGIAGEVGEIVLQGAASRVVFTLDSADATLSGKVTGSGVLVKNGAKQLSLGSTGAHDYDTAGGVEINGGTLKCPQAWDPNYKTDAMYFDRVYVAKGATFHTCGQYCTTILARLEGEGTVCNYTYCTKTYMGWPLRLEASDRYAFDGLLDGYINLQVNATVDLLNTKSSLTGGAGVYLDKADIGVMSFGNGGSKSSLGLTYNYWEQSKAVPFQWNSKGRLRYLGPGESTDRHFRLDAGYPATLDAGVNGPLTLTGKIYSHYAGYANFVLAGSNTVDESVLAGEWAENGDYSTRLVKQGPGIWRLAHADTRRNAGVVAVEEGTLRVDTLAAAGTPCSLGLSTNLREAWQGETVEPQPVDYAILLGSAEAEGRLEYTGKLWDNSVTNRPIAVTGRGGRLVSGGANRRVGFKGAFAADAAGATLTLDGAGTTNYLYDATDGHGPLSVAKEGAGTWILAGDQTFSGRLAVKAGTLVVSATAGRAYSWYRFTLKQSTIWAWRTKNPKDTNSYLPSIREIMLFNKDGYRIDNGLTAVDACTIPAAGQVAVWQDAAAVTDVYKIFDHDEKTRGGGICGGDFPRLDKRSTWIPFVMHLDAEKVGTAVTYDMLTRDYAGNPWDMQCWRLEASADGIFWDTLSDIDNDEPVAWDNLKWFSSGETYVKGSPHQGYPIGLDNGKSLITGTPDQLANAVVSVEPGATLKAEGTVTISKLEVAPSGAGRFEGLAFAADGIVNLAGVTRLTTTIEVPMDISGDVRFTDWSVTLGGRRSLAKASFANGILKIEPSGLTVLMR